MRKEAPFSGGYPLVLLDVVRFATARAAATLSGVVALVAATSGARVAASGARVAASGARAAARLSAVVTARLSAVVTARLSAVVTARLSAVVTARSVTAVTFLGHFTAKGSNLTHLAKLGVAPVLGVAHDEVYASDAGSVHLLGVVLTTRGHADGEETQVGEAYALAIEDEFLEAVEGVHQNTMYGATRVRRVVL